MAKERNGRMVNDDGFGWRGIVASLAVAALAAFICMLGHAEAGSQAPPQVALRDGRRSGILPGNRG